MGIDRRTAAIIAAAVAGGSIIMCGLCAVGSALVADRDSDGAAKPPAASSPVAPTPATATPSPAATSSTSRPAASPSPTGTPAPMPSLIGRNAAVALDDLKRLGITNVQLGSATAGDTMVLLATNWTVIEQSIPVGTVVQPGQLVVLTCKKNA